MHASSQAISHASNQFDQSTPSVNAELESYHATTDIDNGDVGVGGEGTTVEFVPLIGHPDYEILNIHPFHIRRVGSNKLIKPGVKSDGYIRVILNGKQYQKHVLVAKQFIPNDDATNKPYVDHIDHDRANYQLSNLRWVSASEILRNRASHHGVEYTYVKQIPENAIVVDDYMTRDGVRHTFTDYYFHDDVFYFFNGINYRILYINENASGSKYVNLNDDNHRKVAVCYSIFKSQHDLL